MSETEDQIAAVMLLHGTTQQQIEALNYCSEKYVKPTIRQAMTPTHERISRKAECIKWDGQNTVAVMGMLARNAMIGELYRGGEFILVYHDGGMLTSLNRGTWVLIGEDERVRFYSDADMQMMYRPINDELERLRAFARDILNLECPEFQSWQKKCIAGKHGITVDILKAPE